MSFKGVLCLPASGPLSSMIIIVCPRCVSLSVIFFPVSPCVGFLGVMGPSSRFGDPYVRCKEGFLCRAEGCGATGYEGSRLQKEFHNGAKLLVGGASAKRLVQTGAWLEVTHLVECQSKFSGEVPQATAFLINSLII